MTLFSPGLLEAASAESACPGCGLEGFETLCGLCFAVLPATLRARVTLDYDDALADALTYLRGPRMTDVTHSDLGANVITGSAGTGTTTVLSDVATPESPPPVATVEPYDWDQDASVEVLIRQGRHVLTIRHELPADSDRDRGVILDELAAIAKAYQLT